MKKINWIFLGYLVVLLAFVGCASSPRSLELKQKEIDPNIETQTAVFAGGCFWCMESGFEAQEGVVEVISGYSGGDEVSPSYELVSTGMTGHYESVKVYYDPKTISYEKLLESFWIQIDPTDPDGQFADKGPQYRTAIFYETKEQKELAEKSKEEIANYFDKPIVTEILELKNFYPAEEYHQDYYLKQELRYKSYEALSGRKAFVEQNKKLFSKSKEDLKETLTPLQYSVTQKDGTEPAFDNEYWNNTREGIYVDIILGDPLFSSTDKYKSGTGWPSFTKPITPDAVVEKKDYKLLIPRTEVRSSLSDAHLGHVFDDGPQPTGLRYCMNSAALRFIPKEDLEKEGYGDYLYLFE